MNLVDTHLTPILGIDIHFTTSWNPFHPFIGFVMDPMDYVPFIGATGSKEECLIRKVLLFHLFTSL